MCRSVTLAMSLNAFLIAVVAAQQEQPMGPMAPKPGKEHLELAKMEGVWDAVTTIGDKKTKGEATYKMDCGGLWLASTFKGEMEGQPFTGRGLDSYDPAKKRYVGVWVDSMITSPLIME